jgi:hypothetical protein
MKSCTAWRRRGACPARRLVLAAACALLWPAQDSSAWGRLGHEIAGSVCAGQLDGTARARVQELLGPESLAEASHWADRMRDDPARFWQEEAGPYHYVTVPPGRRYADIGAPPEGDGVTALALFARQLRAPDTRRAQRQLALRFAVHIVQDLHQPLHVGNGSDRGGNDRVVFVDGERSNLHRVWDTTILASAGRSRADWLRRLEAAGLLRAPRTSDADPLLWIGESAALRDTLYPVPRRIDAAYLARHLTTVEQRIAEAGVRCAAWLNLTLADAPALPRTDAQDERSPWWRRLFRS